MEQPQNLLSEFNVTGKYPASYWQGRMMALKAGGLDDFRVALDAALKSDNPKIVEEAKGALRVLKRIAQQLGITHEAVAAIFDQLQPQYLEARNITAEGMKIKRGTPAAAVYKEFPSLYATCHAHAEAALPSLNHAIDNAQAEGSGEIIPLKEDDTPGLADEEGTVTPKKSDPLSQDRNVPDNTDEYAVDLGKPAPADTTNEVGNTDWTEILGTESQSTGKVPHAQSKGKGAKRG